MDIVDVQLVEHQRPILAARVENERLEPKLVRRDVHRPAEFPPVEIEAQDAVEARGGQEQPSLPDRYLVAVLEIRISPRAERPEIRRVCKQLVAGGDVDGLAVE